MGLWDKIKGWLNIGGVDVKLLQYTEPLRRSNPVVTGTVLMKTKTPRRILSVEVRFIEEHTYKKNEQKKTDTTVLGSYRVPGHGSGLGYPREIKPGEELKEPFTLNVAVSKRLQDFGGVIGAVGKVGAFLGGEKVEYYLVAEADVEGTPLDPTHKVKMKVTE